MNKSLKIVSILSLTLLVSALAFVLISSYTDKADKDAALMPESTNKIKSEEKNSVKIQVERQTDDPLQRVYEREMIDQLAIKSRNSEFSAPPADVDLNDLNGQLPFNHVPLESFKKDSDHRLLEGNTLTQPGIIAFDHQSQSGYKYYAYRHVFNNLREYSTQFVVYPYEFTYSPVLNDPDQDIAFKKGAIFSLKPDMLPTDPSLWNYFDSIKAATDVSFGKAKALYDVNIAILSIADYYSNIYMDLFYESSVYCNVLTSYLAKYKDCLPNTNAYYAFKNDTKNAGKTALLMMGPDEVRDLLMTADGAPRFQLLIISDHFGDAESIIYSRLGAAGIATIKEYVNKGGNIFANGKSGKILEDWGILPKGFYKTDNTVTTTESNQELKIKGCNGPYPDFWTALLCMNVDTGGGYGYSYLSGAYEVDQSKTAGFTVVNSYDETSKKLKKRDNVGFLKDLTNDEKAYLPFSMVGNYGKGVVILIHGNPLFKSGHNEIFYNALMLAMSKNIVFDAYIGTKDNKPIPGGEAGIQLDVSLSFINLFDTPINDMKVHMWFPNNVVPTQLPADCAVELNPPSFEVNLNGLNPASHIACSQATVAGFGKFSAVVNVEILDATVTQQKYDILMVSSAVEYLDTETMLTHRYDAGGIRTDAALAALLRGALNPDPSSFYPIKGRGQYVDNVLQVENKEDTKALDVEYIGMVPLISPVVDGSDQTAVIQAARLLSSYYVDGGRTYHYPFTNTLNENFDILDFQFLNEKDVVLCAEWDIPVKPVKITRPDSFPVVPATGPFDIINLSYTTNIDSKNIVLQQTFYESADKFFEHAAQRLMVFVDISKEKGAAARYPSGIPDGERNPRRPTVAKKEFIWTRSDVYFYPAQDYQMPANINYKHVISVDKYPAPATACVEKLGAAKSVIMEHGYFSYLQPDGLKPNEWSNELLMHCRTKVELDQVETVSGGSIKPIHYLVPVTDPEVQEADDIMYFVNKNDGTGEGYLEDYPDLKFIKAHFNNMLVDGSISRQGGKLEVIFDPSVSFTNEDTEDPVAKGYITYSADQVAFVKTEYDKVAKKLTGYFKRGLMPNEAYGKSSLLGIMIEQLSVKADTPVSVKIYEMKYDISKPEKNFESYILREERSLTLKFDRFYSLPAVEIHVKMNRGGDTAMFAYELLEAFSRFGVYIQELQKHRTVYASTETHNVNDPGVVAINGGFAMVSNLGISSVPFAEYVTTGRALLIPSCPTTSRLEWFDIWGRKWSQPLRSLFPDIPPIPPPLKNFIMTTTFELTKKGTKERVFSWVSDEELDIHVQIKLLNNYPKYFEITTCSNNNVTYFQTRDTMFEKARIFDPDTSAFEITNVQAPTDRYHINYGHRSSYGQCFDEDGTVLEGNVLDEGQRNIIRTAYLCANNPDPAAILACTTQLSGLPTVKRRPIGNTFPVWMYNPKVERYYPVNYIKANMWDLTHYDYDDNPMDKAYKYHMDNNLPGIDFGPPQNPARYKPHNLIAQPIFKGFGYKISYEKTKSLARFPTYHGWWSDNLQNKDHTLVAGQATVNDISVDKATLLPDSMWINAKDITDSGTQAVINSRLHNIHVCMFNQHRVKLSPNQQRIAYLANVYQNNIIPIMPDLEKNDPRLTSFDCTNVIQKTPTTISEVDNIVITPTIRDWLYFAANLRGGATETINIPYSLSPIPGIKIEGLTKVQDGGRFVYWNPANGPNSFLIVDNPVNVVESSRSDLAIEAEVIPKFTTTFKSVLYHLIKVSDPAEILREWKFDTYTNNFGFGDAVVAVFVGGIQASLATIGPGESTFVKITFYNNAGFDWNMFGGAIDFDLIGHEAISANDLLMREVHAIQKPLAYNFMILDIPEALRPYITIIPSDHNIDVAPQFFDFMNINVVQIRDGYKGDYYYKITLNSNLPTELLGKVHEIKLSVKESCFDKLPGYNDPTGKYHDYKLSIPSIKFGIPYGPTHKYAGKVFYTSGYSSEIKISAGLPSYWDIDEARLISDAEVDDVRLASGNPETVNTKLKQVWNDLNSHAPIPVTSTISGTEKTILLDMSTVYPKFPQANGNDPDIAYFNLLLKAEARNVPYGTAVRVLSSPRLTYKDLVLKAKNDVIAEPKDKTVGVTGPSIGITYNCKLVIKENGEYVDAPDDRFFNSDESGIIRVILIMANNGNGNAYKVSFTMTLAQGVELITDQIPEYLSYNLDTSGVDTLLNLITGLTLNGFTNHAEKLYLKFTKAATRRLLQTGGTVPFTVIKSVSANIYATEEVTAPVMSQAINNPLVLSFKVSDRDTVALSVSTSYDNNLPVFLVSASATPPTVNGKNVRYEIVRRMVQLDCEDDQGQYPGVKCVDVMNINWVTIKSVGFESSTYDRPIPSTFTGTIKSGIYDMKVTTYDDAMKQLATSTIQIIAERPTSAPSNNPNPTPTPTPTPTPKPGDPNYQEPNGDPTNPDDPGYDNTTNSTNSTEKVEVTLGEEYKLPTYAIVLIPLCAFGVIMVAAILIYRKYRLVKIIPDNSSEVVVKIDQVANFDA